MLVAEKRALLRHVKEGTEPKGATKSPSQKCRTKPGRKRRARCDPFCINNNNRTELECTHPSGSSGRGLAVTG